MKEGRGQFDKCLADLTWFFILDIVVFADTVFSCSLLTCRYMAKRKEGDNRGSKERVMPSQEGPQ
jgi:hypothetical protein